MNVKQFRRAENEFERNTSITIGVENSSGTDERTAGCFYKATYHGTRTEATEETESYSLETSDKFPT